MTESWQYPVATPIFTDALIEEWVERAATEERKSKAFDTPFRFSDAGGCAKVMAYTALGAEAYPMDASGVWVTGLGSVIHEWLQTALARRYPGLQVEVKGLLVDVTSGHCDAVVTIGGVRWLFELKTTGAFGFDKAVGLARRKRTMSAPQGPRKGLLQGALNALANDCTMLAIGYISMEAVSIQVATHLGMRQLDRVIAEWHIPEDVWRPLAEAELERQSTIVHHLALGFMPAGEAVDDYGHLEPLDPTAYKTPWQCDYCRFRARCDLDGAHAQPIPVDLRRAA